jgi:4-amino-4-deoxy-L-arabinose transferase-like glycosyltransferase
LHFYKPFPSLILFFVLACVLRFFSFFPSVIDQDESTYIVIADALLQGYTYQVDFVDTKPIGMFILLAMWQALFGSALFGIRLFAALVLGLTAWFLYRARLSGGSRQEAALASGVSYLFLNSIFTFYGVSPNTEIFFNLFVAWALWIFWSKSSKGMYLITGLLLGVGFVIKYVVMFDGIAWGLFLLAMAVGGHITLRVALTRSVLMAVGAAIPFSMVLLIYWLNGYDQVFWFYSLTVPGRYPESSTLWSYLKFTLDYVLRFLPITLFFIVAWLRTESTNLQRRFAMWWAAGSLTAVLVTGKFYGHYFVQFSLPFAYWAGTFFSLRTQETPRWLRWVRQPRWGLPALGILVLANAIMQYKDYYLRNDLPQTVADYLKPRLQPGDRVYLSHDQITYHLLGQLPLIRYVHPSLFWDPDHIAAMEIDVNREVKYLMDEAPRYLVLRHPLPDGRLDDWVETAYTLIERTDSRTSIYQRRDTAPDMQ